MKQAKSKFFRPLSKKISRLPAESGVALCSRHCGGEYVFRWRVFAVGATNLREPWDDHALYRIAQLGVQHRILRVQAVVLASGQILSCSRRSTRTRIFRDQIGLES